MPTSVVRVNPLTQLLALSASGVLRGLPLLWLALHARHAPVSKPMWWSAAAASVGIQALLLLAARRCSGERMSFGQGLLLVAASMTTGWLYWDMLVVVLAVWSIHLASCVLAVLPRAAEHYAALVGVVFRSRLER